MSMDESNEPHWTVERPNVLVVACSDGRLQEVTDAFLSHSLGITRYDRFYAPGGAGALSATGRDFSRARRMREECHYLIDLHRITRAILLFHGPAADGPAEAVCADYRRKLPYAAASALRDRQNEDAHELLKTANEWAGEAAVDFYRCEVDKAGFATFVSLY